MKLFNRSGKEESPRVKDVDISSLFMCPPPKEYRNLSDLVNQSEQWNRKGATELELLSLEMLRDYLSKLIEGKQPVQVNTEANYNNLST